jgi:uncharacterized coiled-coil DUF342 family protein
MLYFENMTFTKAEQDKLRKAFIDECRQKAWSARCHADWISKSMDQLAAEVQKRQKEDGELDAAIKAAETAIDFHTVENRNKRKAMQERRNQLGREIGRISENRKLGQQSLQGLYQSIESNLELAKHAEGWEWKEAKPNE